MTDWAKELDSLTAVMQIQEELGGDSEPAIRDLVSVTRRWVRTEECFVREAAQSKKTPHRLYLFKDMFILASLVGPAKPTQKVKLAHCFGIRQCQVKENPKEDAAEGAPAGLILTTVTRLRMGKDGVLTDSAACNTGRIVTSIGRIEIWFSKRDVRDDVIHEVQASLEELDEDDLQENESQAGSEDGQGTVRKTRSWAQKRATLKAARKASSPHMAGRNDSLDDTLSTTGSEGLSLADLEARYSIDFKTPTTSTAERIDFEISFGEGPMGFSLGSAKGVGVIIGKLAPGSFADIGGVCIGDRIIWIGAEVEGIPVDVDMTWQDCVAKIKALPRPITIRFERTSTRQVDPEKRDREHQDSASSATPSTSGEGSESSQEGTKRRAWANRRAQRAASMGAGMINLNELERVYKETAGTAVAIDFPSVVGIFDKCEQAHPSDKPSIMVLKEILTTERDYVADLRALVGEYIIPLRRAVRRRQGKCRELEGMSTVCEHGLIRKTCNRQSTELIRLMDAESMKTIFCNTETLMIINAELLDMIVKGLNEVGKATKSAPSLADLAGVFAKEFKTIMPFFKIYSVYCHQYQSAVERLSTLRSSNGDLHRFLSEREEKSKHVTLNSLLIKPVQRICKYPLLFSTLLRELDKSSGADQKVLPHVALLREAAVTVDKIALSVNDQVAENDAMERMLRAFEELGGEKGAPGLVEAHRRFVRTDDVIFVEQTGDKLKEDARILYVFNDIVVVAKAEEKSKSGTLGSPHPDRQRVKNLTGSRKSLSQGHTAIAKQEMSLDVQGMTLTALSGTAKNKTHGIGIKYVSKKIDETTAKRTLGSPFKKVTLGSGKIVTSIEKFELWTTNATDRDDLQKDLQKQIDLQLTLSDGQKKAEQEVGAPKKQHSWASAKSKGDATESLQALADKYKKTGA